jgi:aldose 1-epimerase
VAPGRRRYPDGHEPDAGRGALMRAGELFEIRSGNRRAVVTEQGASLARVTWDGAELLVWNNEDGYAGHGAYGQILVPFPGRVTQGRYEYEGERYQLPITDYGGMNAIHGWARWMAWQLVQRSADSVTLSCHHLASPGYPFPLELEQSYAWRGDGLEVSFQAKNVGGLTAPFGYGCHPYFTVGSVMVDDDVLHVPANDYLEVVDGLQPTGKSLPVDGSPFDFRQPRAVGAVHLDVTLTDLDRDEEGKVVVRFSSPTGGTAITLKYDEAIRFLQLYSGDTLPDGRRRGLAVEPYTCAPDAFNNGLGLAHLAPGGSLQTRWALTA